MNVIFMYSTACR